MLRFCVTHLHLGCKIYLQERCCIGCRLLLFNELLFFVVRIYYEEMSLGPDTNQFWWKRASEVNSRLFDSFVSGMLSADPEDDDSCRSGLCQHLGPTFQTTWAWSERVSQKSSKLSQNSWRCWVKMPMDLLDSNQRAQPYAAEVVTLPKTNLPLPLIIGVNAPNSESSSKPTILWLRMLVSGRILVFAKFVTNFRGVFPIETKIAVGKLRVKKKA